MNLKKYQKSELYFLIACVLITLFLLIGILQSFLGPFIFSTIFAAALLPLHKKLVSKLRIKENISAIILIILLTTTIILPAFFILTNSYEEMMGLIQSLKANASVLLPEEQRPQNLPVFLHQTFVHYSGLELPRDVFIAKWHQYVESAADQLLEHLNLILGNILVLLANFFIFIFGIYVILTQRLKLKKTFFRLSPLPEKDEEFILKRFENLNRSLLLGNSIGGSIQSMTGFVLMSFMGLEKLFFWSLLIFLSSFVPVLGTSVIFIPMSIYLWFMGKKALAVTLLCCMGVMFVLVENWFKPQFIGGRIQMNSLLILFSMLGGVSYFGMPGIFYGPIIATLFLSFMDLYIKQMSISNQS